VNNWGFRWPGCAKSFNPFFMKTLVRSLSYVFHPLVMPTLGLLLMLNSGTYLALLDPAAKKAILFVMALGTLLFPVLLLPVLYYRNLTGTFQGDNHEGRLVKQGVILILYVITFIYFIRLPLSRVIDGYLLSVILVLLVSILLNLKFRVSFHMAALGGISGLIIALMILYQTPLKWFLVFGVLAAGITGTARLASGSERPAGLVNGFLLGFALVLVTLLVY